MSPRDGPATRNRLPHGRMKLLIADDDRISRLLLRSILLALPDCTLVEAPDGHSAWDLLNEPPPPDLCILDNVMPGLTGLALLERIRQEPKLARLPVILCTSSRELDCVERAARLRARHYILKPFQAQLVRQTVLQAYRETQAHQALADPDEVCQRLGLSRQDYAALLAELLADLEPALTRVGAALGDGTLPTALLETNALRGACAHLGARPLAEALARMEEALRHTLPTLQNDTTPYDIRSQQVARLVGLLEHLRYEASHLVRAAQTHLAPPVPTAAVSDPAVVA